MKITEDDFNQIKGLLHYLNGAWDPVDHDLAADVTITDSNGDTMGVVKYEDGEYGFWSV